MYIYMYVYIYIYIYIYPFSKPWSLEEARRKGGSSEAAAPAITSTNIDTTNTDNDT